MISIDELAEKYIQQNKTMAQIAEEYGVSIYVVRKDLMTHNIKIRKKGYGHLVKKELILTTNQFHFFDGLIAGDGSICPGSSNGRRSVNNACVPCGFKHEEFARYIVDTLGLKCDVKPYTHYSERYSSGSCKMFKFNSGNNIFFTKQRIRWYPEGKKVLPSDFVCSSVALNILYLCDGYLIKKKGYRSVRLCTQSFLKENIEEVLIAGLKANGIYAHVTPDNQVMLNTENSRAFLKFIGPCPVECYKYKWDV